MDTLVQTPHGDFEWDEDKRIANLGNHRVDFEYAILAFRNPLLTRIDDSENYGEIREVSLGMIDGVVLVIVHTDRGDVTRIISARKGGKRDHATYYESLA